MHIKREREKINYLVLRTDAHSTTYVASIHNSREEAEERIAEFVSHEHRQTYKVKENPTNKKYIVGDIYEEKN